jgi:Peptidase family M28
MRRAAAIALPLLAVLALASWRSYGPPPAPGPMPEIMRVAAPHPVGSPANSAVRDRIVAELRSYGYEPTIQRRFACNARITCATVENILARLPGQSPDTVVLAAHYDSVRFGPGVSDDLMGTAALLDAARAVRGRRFRNTILFLVTDGEEAGLLGAEAFAADPALMKDVAIVVNVENRGTYGASNMFETSRGNRWLIRRLAGALPRPQATSLYQTVYDLLPNDTDVSVFKRDGKAVLNFAAIRGVQWYHTPLDDLAHASPRTLQHHRENMLSTLRALADADLAARTRDDAVYFDVLGFFLAWWPAGWTVWIAVASLILLVFAVRKGDARSMTFGVLATFAAILFAGFGGFAIGWLARLRSADVANWVAYSAPSIIAMWLTGLAAALFAARLFRRKEREMIVGAALVFHAAAIVLAITIPGPSFLFLVPAVLVTLAALAKMNETAIGAIAATGAAIVIFPMGLLLYDALGTRLMATIAVLITLVAIWIAPLFRGAVVVLALAIVSAALAVTLPAYSKARPKPDWPDAKEARVQLTRNGNVIRARSLEGPGRIRVEVDRPVVSVNGIPPAPPTRRRPRPVESILALNVEELVVVTK